MLWPTWYSAKFRALLIGLTMIIGCVLLLEMRKGVEPSEANIVRAIRLATHPITNALEEHAHLLTPNHPELLERVEEWLDQIGGVQLQVSLMDGTVVYDNSKWGREGSHQISLSRIQPRFDLDYGLRISEDMLFPYHLALPLFASEMQSVIGYAQFHLPAEVLHPLLPAKRPWTVLLYILMTLGMILILYVAVSIGRRLYRDYIKPINELKLRAEAILQGDYEQRAEWERNDEVGALYAVFDQMRAEIRELNLKQIAQSQSHKELISNLSHDLKTPLSTVRAYMEAMLGGLAADAASRENYIQIALAHLNKMTVLLDDLLFHELRGLAQLSVHPQEQYAEPILAPILQSMSHYIRTMGVRCEWNEQIPNVLIRIDAVRIEQVISNLVINALKHTNLGGVIRLSLSEATTSSALEITVSDTGSGISPADMPFIFERSYQGTASQQSGSSIGLQTGVGLGLSICKQIVDAHVGTISFYSREQEGTTFCVTLPLS